MGAPVPYMPLLTGLTSVNEARQMQGAETTKACACCTQCGAPHEAHASVCGYCLSPRLDLGSPDLIEVTSLNDSVRRFVRG